MKLGYNKEKKEAICKKQLHGNRFSDTLINSLAHLGGLGDIAAGWKFADWAGLCMEFWVILYGGTIGCCITSVHNDNTVYLFVNIKWKLVIIGRFHAIMCNGQTSPYFSP